MHVIKQSILSATEFICDDEVCYSLSFCFAALPFGLSQLTYGTTGLLHAPSAEMQRDKTFMVGGNFSEQGAHTAHLVPSYLQLFPECQLSSPSGSSLHVHALQAEALGLKPYGYSGFTNQDRYFSARLRC